MLDNIDPNKGYLLENKKKCLFILIPVICIVIICENTYALSRHWFYIGSLAVEGEKDQSIFYPNLQTRSGKFIQYGNGGIKSYHISYYANTPFSPDRRTSNLQKNPDLYIRSNGLTDIRPSSHKKHTITLIKNGFHIQLAADAKKVIVWIDR